MARSFCTNVSPSVSGESPLKKIALLLSHLAKLSASSFNVVAKAGPTLNPSSASLIAGAITFSNGKLPYFFRAYSIPATVPGTPTAK